jgi:hypothetical protein
MGCLLIAAACCALPAATWAQPPHDDGQPERPHRDFRGPAQGPRGPGPEGRAPQDRHGVPLHELFPPQPDDRAALSEEEAEALLAFADEHFPRLARSMRWIKSRRPEMFVRRMQRTAPRLRHLQRIFAFDQAVGAAVVQHTKRVQRLRRAHAVVHQEDAPAARRAEAVEALRNTLADLVEIETFILEQAIARLEETREQRVDARLAMLLAGQVPPERIPPRVRTLLERYRASVDGERDAARAALRALVAAREAREEKAWKTRLEFLKDHPEQVVDQRVEMMQEHPPRFGPRLGPDEQHRGRRGGGPHRRGNSPG